MHGAGVGRVPGGPAEDHTVDGHLHAGIMGAVLWLTEQILKFTHFFRLFALLFLAGFLKV